MIIIPTGTILYHGTFTRLPNGLPNRNTGTWFSRSRNQSVFHATNSRQGFLYKYTVIKPISLIHFNSIKNFNAWAISRGHVMNSLWNSFIKGAGNKVVAQKLCKSKNYAGWSFPALQDQIMLCNPSEYLKLEDIYKIKSKSTNTTFNVKNNTAMWRGSNNYDLEPINLKNIPNIFEPPSNKIYYYFDKKTPVFVNSKGREITRGMNSVKKNEQGKLISIKNIPIIVPNTKIKDNVNLIHRKTLQSRTQRNRNTFFYSFKIKNV